MTHAQAPGTGSDGIRRYSKYSECMQGCGPYATPMPGTTPQPTGMTPMPTHMTPMPSAPAYKPGHVVSFACENDCLPVSGIWPDQKTSFSSRSSCMDKCGRTKSTTEPGWGTGVIEGDEVLLPVALVGNIDRHVLNYM